MLRQNWKSFKFQKVFESMYVRIFCIFLILKNCTIYKIGFYIVSSFLEKYSLEISKDKNISV